jgi:hypothetical protein
LVAAISLLTVGCGGKSGYDMKEVAGVYKVLSFSEDGVENEQMLQLLQYGIYMYVDLKEDGTGVMTSVGQDAPVKWDGKAFYDLSNESAVPTEYTYADGTLSMISDDLSMVMVKLNDEELANYNENGSNVDFEALAKQMMGEVESGDAGAGDATESGEDADEGAEAGDGENASAGSADTATAERPFFLPDLSAGPHGDTGYYEINSYEENGVKYAKDELDYAGISFDMMLNADGTGYAHFLGERYELSWLDGMVVVAVDNDVQELKYDAVGSESSRQITIADDVSTMIFGYKKEADIQSADGTALAAADGTGSGSDAAKDSVAGSGSGSDAAKDSVAGTGSGSDSADGSSGKNGAATERPAGVPGGDGYVSDEELLKGYVWLNEVKSGVFETTYEELADYFGVDGEFDKEEYLEDMKQNRRYYFWRSNENEYNFIYVNFGEDKDKPGVYKITGYNTNGFSNTDAINKYLDEVKAEEIERNKAASANAKMKPFSVEIFPRGLKEENGVTFVTEIPESGWSYDEGKKHLVESDDTSTWHAGFIELAVEKSVEKFDKDWDDYKEVEDRVIGGITFKGRTYTYVGYDWKQYVAQIDDNRAVSIGMVFTDDAEGTMTDKILSGMSFK